MGIGRYRGRHLRPRPKGRAPLVVGAATAAWVVGPAARAATHVVSSGETLSSIANRYGVSIAAIARANKLDDPNLVVTGQRLRVPGTGGGSAPGATSSTHTVRAGETLSSIASRYGVSVRALARANRISNPNFIVSGTKLRVRGGASTSGSTVTSASGSHRVAAGETLASIADRYGTTVTSLARINNIANPNLIVAGSKLRVPGSAPAPSAAASSAVLPYVPRATIEDSIERQASAHGVDPSLVKATAWLESGWQQDVVSSAGAVGVMQVMPGTAKYINSSLGGHGLNFKEADDNIHLGVMYIDHLIEAMGSENRALAAYYTGPGNVGSRLSKTQRWYAHTVQKIRRRFR